MEKKQHEALLAALGQLKSLVEEQLAEIRDKIEYATEVMRENTEEAGLLRDKIAELRELYQWTLNNGPHDTWRPFQLTSMPLDPAAADFAERVNRYTADDLPSGSEPEPDFTRQQTSLF